MTFEESVQDIIGYYRGWLESEPESEQESELYDKIVQICKYVTDNFYEEEDD